ncbi:hypothetical protein GCM10009777_18980 [Microbacterium pumilum]|uniref:Uncharacterized protein n=1 Tax=Microbacterium pumilum TaxID=344165 RepID=A0ABN2SE95_9MICO
MPSVLTCRRARRIRYDTIVAEPEGHAFRAIGPIRTGHPMHEGML